MNEVHAGLLSSTCTHGVEVANLQAVQALIYPRPQGTGTISFAWFTALQCSSLTGRHVETLRLLGSR